MDKWYCEQHPEQEMGHDGCSGAGITEDARLWMAAVQRRNALQKMKEFKAYYSMVIVALIDRIKELEYQTNKNEG